MAQHHNMSYILLQASSLHTHLVCALMLFPVFVYASPIHPQAKRNTGMDARMGWMPPSMDTHSQALGYSSTDTPWAPPHPHDGTTIRPSMDAHHTCQQVRMAARPAQVLTHATHTRLMHAT